jgi:hypothetical protein
MHIASSSSSSQFHLFMEPLASAGISPGKEHSPLRLPSEVCFLAAPADKPPELRTEPFEPDTAALVLEAVTLRDGQPRLALVRTGARRLCVNGQEAPRFLLLSERDQFQFDDSCAFHVTIFHRPQIGPAPADLIGKPCYLCLRAFADDPDSLCYRCPCGTLLHLRDPSGLECARAVSECAHCKRRIMLEEGYTWLPEFCRE